MWIGPEEMRRARSAVVLLAADAAASASRWARSRAARAMGGLEEMWGWKRSPGKGSVRRDAMDAGRRFRRDAHLGGSCRASSHAAATSAPS